MNKTTIDWGIKWPFYTLNPVVGCRRSCTYCYAKRIHTRFNKTPFDELQYHPERLDEIDKLKKPSTIFVGSMSDVCFWDSEILNIVLVKCRLYAQHTYMFLTKDPTVYLNHEWPDNTMQGLTMDLTQPLYAQQRLFLEIVKSPRPFLSLEPLLGELKIEIDDVERVIVGAMTGPNAVVPRPEWIRSVKELVPKDKLYWKKSIGMVD